MTYLVRSALLLCCFHVAQAMERHQDTISLTRDTLSLTQRLSLGRTDSTDGSDDSATQRLSQSTEEFEDSDDSDSDEHSSNSRASTLVQGGKRRLTYAESESESGYTSTSTDSARPISPLPGGTVITFFNEDGTVKSTNQTGTLQRSNAFIWDGKGKEPFNSPKFQNVKKPRK